MPENALTAGVIGGLGPDATVDFMARVLALTPAEQDQDHIHLLVDQNPAVPNRQAAILRGGKDAGAALAAMASGLEAAGADFIVMPCNAAHAFEQQIAAAISVPFVSIIDATVESVADDAKRIGVLETPACQAAGLYQSALDERGKEFIGLDTVAGEELMRLAYEIKLGDRGSAVKAAMRSLAQALLARGAEAVIAGCTEIPLVLGAEDVEVPLISSTDALARRTIALAKGEQPLPKRDKR